MEYLLHNQATNEYKLYHSLRRLCKENRLDPDRVKKQALPMLTPIGLIVGIVPDTRI